MDSESDDESDDWDPEIQTKTIFDRKVIVFTDDKIKKADTKQVLEEEKFENKMKTSKYENTIDSIKQGIINEQMLYDPNEDPKNQE